MAHVPSKGRGSVHGARSADQAQLPIFRALLVVEILAAGVFGLVPFVLPVLAAKTVGFVGDEPFIYRLAGAASFGYAVMAWIGYRQPAWHRMRIPLIATLTFTAAAVVASALSLLNGEQQFIIYFVLIVSVVFSILSLYWVVRNVGPRAADGGGIEAAFRTILLLATAAAAVFGVVPLLAPKAFMSFAGFKGTDLYIGRAAGAATLGYAVAGVYQLRARNRAEIHVQVIGALVFNGLSAIAAALYVIEGGRSPVGVLILVAATFFSASFIWWLTRQPR